MYTYIDEYLKQLSELELQKIESKLDEWGLNTEKFHEKLDDWFSNFDIIEDKKLAFKIFENIEYINSEKFKKMIQRLGKLVKKEIVSKSMNIDNAILITPEGEADSANRHAYDVVKEWGFSREQVCSVESIDNIIKESSILIALNDTYGSGNQFIEEIWEKLKRYSKTNMIIIAGVIITEKAIERFKRISPEICIIPKVGEKDKEYLFTPNEYKRIKELGEAVYSDHPMGYGNTGLLVSYYFQCPNNTFPIIWADGTNNIIKGRSFPWNPLFEYKPKKK